MTKVNRRFLSRLLFRSFFLQTGFCYERLQALGWCWVIAPLVKRFQIPNPAEFYQKNLQPFNANPYISTYAVGAVARLEEEKKEPEEIQRVKNSLRGPLGSLGDNLIWKNVRPALLVLGIIASGWISFWGPILFLVSFNAFQLYLRGRGLRKGFQLGEQIFVEFSGSFWRKVTYFFGALGALLLGFWLIQKGAEYVSWNSEIAFIFLAALILGLVGFYKRISAFDTFLLCLGSGVVIKFLLTFI